MGKARDITGERFGKLVALTQTNKMQFGTYIWRCRCDCGTFCEKPLKGLSSKWALGCNPVCHAEGKAMEHRRRAQLPAVKIKKQSAIMSLMLSRFKLFGGGVTAKALLEGIKIEERTAAIAALDSLASDGVIMRAPNDCYYKGSKYA